MSTFEVKARKIEVLDHPNADRLSLAKIDGYVAVIGKDSLKTGDLVIYIPEGSIVPEKIQEELGVVDKLAGGSVVEFTKMDSDKPMTRKLKDRVKAVRLRGVLSQGLVYKPNMELVEGQDYAEQLGITKYAPPVPMEMSGKVEHDPRVETYTDIENIKRYPDVLQKNDMVRVSEKIHGTATCLHYSEGDLFVSSKGLAKSQQAILETEGNVYWKALRENGIDEVLPLIAKEMEAYKVILYGETFGSVQDLKYGVPAGKVEFRAFDLKVQKTPQQPSQYVDADLFDAMCKKHGIAQVPVLFQGLWKDIPLQQLTNGKETVSGKETGIREGVVIRTLKERTDPLIGRVVLKSVSDDYLTRKGEATEYE